MKTRITALPILIFFLNTNLFFSQEWKNLKVYQKETGNIIVQDGCWLEIDRKTQNEVWKKANLYNLSVENGNLKYKTISQIRDFYLWFDFEREKQGHEIKWIGIAEIVAGQLSKLDDCFIRVFIIRDKGVVKFANDGSKKVFEFAFPQLKKVYFSNEIINGKIAENWDFEYGMNEQCIILTPLYDQLSQRTIRKLDRMVKGKGVFIFGVPKELKYVGSIEDCQARFEHGINKINLLNIASKEDKNRYRHR